MSVGGAFHEMVSTPTGVWWPLHVVSLVATPRGQFSGHSTWSVLWPHHMVSLTTGLPSSHRGIQTTSVDFRHLSSNHCYNWVRQKSLETVSLLSFWLVLNWQSMSGRVCLISAHTAYAKTNLTKIVRIETELIHFSYPRRRHRILLCVCFDAVLLP